MSSPSPIAPGSPSSRRALAAAIAALLAASVWLGAHVWLTLDFTDEMQYYTEIAGLVGTGKFFQTDLFLQQLGYVLVLPLFKLHAICFPDQSYLIVFGRLVLLAAYAATGVFFWRATGAVGGCTRAQRIAALAMFAVWIPFQLFALSYNSMAYLLAIAVVAVALTRRNKRFLHYCALISVLLAALMWAYPPAGLALSVIFTLDAGARFGWQRAAGLLALATACAGAIGVAAVALHGRAFFGDLLTAARFTGGFGSGDEIKKPDQLAGLLGLLAAMGIFIRRFATRRTSATPASPSVIGGLVMVGGICWWLAMRSSTSFAPTAAYAALLIALAGNQGTRHLVVTAAVGLLMLSMRMLPMGYFAATVFLVLLTGLAACDENAAAPPLLDLVVIGGVLGVVFSISSGNGLHNFGIGAAAVLPFLALFAARRLSELTTPVAALVRDIGAPAIAILLLAKAVFTPYREERDWLRLERVRDVPAFAGIYTSRVKIEAIQAFRRLAGDDPLIGRRALVAGPHPWIYFALRATPVTPMAFMHFSGKPEAYDFLAERMFRHGQPDVVFLTNPVPRAIGRQVEAWSRAENTVRTLPLPIGFIRRYQALTDFDFAGQVYLLSRRTTGP